MLEASGDGRLFSINPDGSDKTFIVTGCPVPDGVAVDVEAGHIYWTNMGTPPVNDGSIERVDLDGGNRTTIVPSGGTYTPKQLHFDAVDRKLYWADREGMRVMRCDLDGSNVETLVQTGRVTKTAATRPTGASESPSTMSVGISTGRRRAQAMPGSARSCGPGSTFPQANPQCAAATSRWCSRTCRSRSTSRSTTPRGSCTGPTVATRRTATPSIGLRWTTLVDTEPEIVATHLMEGIGIALDPAHDRMFVTDLGGNIYVAALDGSGHRPIRALQGNLTGIAYAELPDGSTREPTARREPHNRFSGQRRLTT